MASSDDEGEAVLQIVSNYHFVDGNDEPIAFSELPVQWKEGAELQGEKKHIFLHGTADNGLQKIYKPVVAWKFDIEDLMPEIFVLSKENNWIKLQKPRKSFEDTVRSILVTVHCLHFVRKNPETSGKSLWDHLSRSFSSYEIRPSVNDLIDHMPIISEAVKWDETLTKSKFLLSLLEEKPQKKKATDEDTRTTPAASFIVDDDIMDECDDDDGSDDELFDSVCCICDNGGDLLCCEGRCMRSFHATEEAGSYSDCATLGLSDEQVAATQNFFCKNCQLKQHQCFACGELGSSDKSSGAEVFPCVSATCGHFYHPRCVAKLLHRDNAAAAEELQRSVSAGESSFICPIHKCIVCKEGEDKTNPKLQFATCRRCPKSYHRKCLPKKIALQENEDEGIIQRAWDDLIPNRILIYCLKHEIDEDLGTPIRNHIKFPGEEPKKKKQKPHQLSCKEKVIQKKKNLVSEVEVRKRTLVKVQKGAGLPSSDEEGDSTKRSPRRKKLKVIDTSKKKSSSVSLGEMLYNRHLAKESEDYKEKDRREIVLENTVKDVSNVVQLDDDSKKRIMSLVKDATSSVSLDDIKERLKLPTTHASSTKYVVDKTIAMGKVEGSVEAVRAALQKLEEGGNIEDAKAVCEPELLHQISRWKNKLRVYLAPFIYGMRYTSFGRHFTKVDKLKEIVNVLHRYVQSGDTIVDFCCGANDFSWLMKMKLDETGKKCSYKNFDIMQAKNDFNFERRDWMSIQANELPAGSQLIMGLNPPFGVNAGLANKFIDKALEFKPKLLILIVPRETERLDKKKKAPYDLIWEDNELLAGKSFYLPGSVDVNDNQLEDWNLSTPPLYLWSRPDWTAKHMAIAQQHGHLSRVRDLSAQQDEDRVKPLASDLPLEADPEFNNIASIPLHDHSVQNEATVPKKSENCDEAAPHDDGQDKVEDQTVELLKKRVTCEEEYVTGGKKTPDQSKDTEQLVKETGTASQKNKKRGGKKRRRGSFSGRKASNERDHHHNSQNRAGPASNQRTGIEENKKYRFNNEEPYSASPTHRWPVGTGPNVVIDYGSRSPGEHFPDYRREGIDSHNYRPPYVSDLEEQYARSAAARSRVGLYGQQDPMTLGQRSTFLGSVPDPAFSSLYGHTSAVASSVFDRYAPSSAIDRYAPRLDELNHMRMQNPGFDQYAGRPGIPGPPPGYRVDSLGFAPGPYRSSQQNSAGWFDE